MCKLRSWCLSCCQFNYVCIAYPFVEVFIVLKACLCCTNSVIVQTIDPNMVDSLNDVSGGCVCVCQVSPKSILYFLREEIQNHSFYVSNIYQYFL